MSDYWIYGHRIDLIDDAEQQAEFRQQALDDTEDSGVAVSLLDMLLKPAIEVTLFLVAVCCFMGMVFAPQIAAWLGVA